MQRTAFAVSWLTVTKTFILHHLPLVQGNGLSLPSLTAPAISKYSLSSGSLPVSARNRATIFLLSSYPDIVLFTVLYYANVIFKYYGSVLFGSDYMPIKFVRSIFKSGDSYRITVPMEIIKALNIKEKERLSIWLTDSQIIIEKL